MKNVQNKLRQRKSSTKKSPKQSKTKTQNTNQATLPALCTGYITRPISLSSEAPRQHSDRTHRSFSHHQRARGKAEWSVKANAKPCKRSTPEAQTTARRVFFFGPRVPVPDWFFFSIFKLGPRVPVPVCFFSGPRVPVPGFFFPRSSGSGPWPFLFFFQQLTRRLAWRKSARKMHDRHAHASEPTGNGGFMQLPSRKQKRGT